MGEEETSASSPAAGPPGRSISFGNGRPSQASGEDEHQFIPGPGYAETEVQMHGVGPEAVAKEQHQTASSPKRMMTLLGDCRDNAQALLEAGDDPIERTNCLDRIRDYLDELWGLRRSREEAFGDVVNQLQIGLANSQAEEVSPQQIQALRSVFAWMAGKPRLGRGDVSHVLSTLLRGGVDIYGVFREPDDPS